jgi:hypothetical protein
MNLSRAAYAEALTGLTEEEIPDYLGANSNLPGPRGNLTLLDAAGDVLPERTALHLADDPDEFLACAGVVPLGRLLLERPGDQRLIDLLTTRAGDPRWRVREAVAIAAQRVGDGDQPQLRALVAGWVASPHPLVVRAGIAAVCEPRLLVDPLTAVAALDACGQATRTLLGFSAADRRSEDVRTLRQALGYCWSVAVAADPVAGLPVFLRLDAEDPDLAWVIKTNRSKQRLARLLG